MCYAARRARGTRLIEAGNDLRHLAFLGFVQDVVHETFGFVDRKDLPSEGAGETPIISIAPAVGNAIFQATGTRLRSMPLVPDGLKAG